MDYEDKKAWLHQYRDAQAEIAELHEEIIQLTKQLRAMNEAVGENHSADYKKARIVLHAAQRKLMREIVAAEKRKQAAVKAVEAVPDSRNREILKRYYILCQKWEEVAIKMHLDYSRVMRRHKAAVMAMQIPEKRKKH